MRRNAPLVSIVITSYNYARFLADSIDSALNQTYRNTEVIVVDDGSTDNSRKIIAAYQPRVIPVLKANGGQASAFNAGFCHAQGEIIIFLDADDRLRHDIVERVVQEFAEHPDIARIQYRMEVIDTLGDSTGMTMPASYLALPNTDFRKDLESLINCSSWSPTSGNAFAAWTLDEVMPMPEPGFRICADYYLSRVNALFGPIRSLPGIGAYYRYHGENQFFRLSIDLDHVRDHILLARRANQHIKQVAQSLGIDGYPECPDSAPGETVLAQRVISLKLDRENHPIRSDSLLPLARHGVWAAMRHTTLPIAMRVVHVVWFVAMVVSSKRIALALAELFFPEQQGSFGRWLGIFKRRATNTRMQRETFEA